MRRRLMRLLDSLRGPVAPRLVVTGMPKSGTTALAMLLGEAARLKVNSDPFYRLDAAGIEFRDALFDGSLTIRTLIEQHRAEFRGGIIKDPNFAFFLDDLLEFFPSTGFVFIVRDPRANIRSILNRLKLPGRPGETELSGSGISDTWRRVLQGRTPDVGCDDYVECAAVRWRVTARTYLERAHKLELVRYEDFNRDKPGVVQAILKGFGLPRDHSIEHVMDRQFQPKGNRSVSWEEFFGRNQLDRIEHICSEEMTALGYRVNVDS